MYHYINVSYYASKSTLNLFWNHKKFWHPDLERVRRDRIEQSKGCFTFFFLSVLHKRIKLLESFSRAYHKFIKIMVK